MSILQLKSSQSLANKLETELMDKEIRQINRFITEVEAKIARRELTREITFFLRRPFYTMYMPTYPEIDNKKLAKHLTLHFQSKGFIKVKVCTEHGLVSSWRTVDLFPDHAAQTK